MKKIKNVRDTHKSLSVSLFLAVMISLTASADLQSSEIHESLMLSIQQAVEAEIRTDTEDQGYVQTLVEVSPIDPRIQVPLCEVPYQFEFTPQYTHQPYMNVKASCPSTDWQLYVNVKVSRTVSVVVFNAALSPNTTITQEHITLADMDMSQIRATSYQAIDELIGTRVKQRTRPGQLVQAHLLCFVCKGDRITITAKSGGMQVATSGVALQDGGLGDSIKVMNTSSRKHLYAMVDSPQHVILNL